MLDLELEKKLRELLDVRKQISSGLKEMLALCEKLINYRKSLKQTLECRNNKK